MLIEEMNKMDEHMCTFTDKCCVPSHYNNGFRIMTEISHLANSCDYSSILTSPHRAIRGSTEAASRRYGQAKNASGRF